ncbi:MAG: hypothetical protein JST22_19325 [Bacteroidetes bacterium]|nr:hypothetical protein [Bacteroidota bacterium]
MILLHPIPEYHESCPRCEAALEPFGWYMPGMRMLARSHCSGCGAEYYGDLAAGHGLYYPMLLDAATGEVFDRCNVPWFAAWLRESYAARTATEHAFHVEQFRDVERPLLLNCLDRLYGHALLKLLNAEYYLREHAALDVIVLVPSYLRWMVPDGVAAVWSVDLPLRDGAEWNDWIAREIGRRLEGFDAALLSIALSHPHPDDYSIESFTGVAPFSEELWHTGAAHTVTYIWRDDRLWEDRSFAPLLERGALEISRRAGLSRVPRQRDKVVVLADALRREFADLHFAVAGLGTPGDLPDWIEDARASTVNAAQERAWCELYARSGAVIGVHGSNMLLPSAHAGSTFELVWPTRWGNIVQDLLVRSGDAREALLAYRNLPISVKPAELAAIVAAYLRDREGTMLNLSGAATRHTPETRADVIARREALRRRS